MGTLLLFRIILQIFHLFFLKAPLLILSTLYSPRSFLVTLNFSTQKSFAESVLNSNRSRFLLGKTSAENSCFSPSAFKYSVKSAAVKNVLFFSSNSANSLCSRACLAISKANSNPKIQFST